jgi:hypothetical protein
MGEKLLEFESVFAHKFRAKHPVLSNTESPANLLTLTSQAMTGHCGFPKGGPRGFVEQYLLTCKASWPYLAAPRHRGAFNIDLDAVTSSGE